MLRRAIAAVVVAGFVHVPRAHAGAVRPGPIVASAAREAARLGQAGERGPMPPGLKWTGIGLLAAGGSIVPLALFSDCTLGQTGCRDERAAAFAVAGVLAGTGALLLVIGHHRRAAPLPSLSFDRGRAVVQHRVTF